MPGLIESLKLHLAVRRFRKSVIGQALAEHTRQYFYSGDTLSWMDQDAKDRATADFVEKLTVVAQAPDPRLELRTQLANHVLACCALNVLALTEEEKAEQPFADNPYISGELHRHIVAAAPHNKEMDEWLWQNDHSLSAEQLLSFANNRSALLLYHVNGFNMARIEMGDTVEPKDWFRPLFEAMMVWEEDGYREKLDLPRLVPGAMGALPYMTFLNFVIQGERNPFFSWTRKFPDLYLAGHGPLTPTRRSPSFASGRPTTRKIPGFS